MWDALIRALAALWRKANALPPERQASSAAKQTPAVLPASPLVPARPSVIPPLPEPPKSEKNPLEGKPLWYLIGAEGSPEGNVNEITEVSYDAIKPCPRGITIKYCNLFDEKNTGRYGPYLSTSDTAQQYHEGQIDPKGEGWNKNIGEQLTRAKAQGFEYVEWDNPDAYPLSAVLSAVSMSDVAGIKVIAKNPLLIEDDPSIYVRQCWGAIVERGAGSPADMDALRRKAGKPDLPVWFVAFGDGRSWAGQIANQARQYTNMGVTYSTAGEYGDSVDLLRPLLPQTMPPAGPAPLPPIPVPPALPNEPVQYGAEYIERWRSMVIRPEREIEVRAIARKLLANKSRYQEIEKATGVPWYVVAVLHQRESDADFNTYLGNGDPLSHPTVNVPAHRGPFASFEAGAVDALRYDSLDKIKSWPIEQIAYCCEKFNGFGYRSHGIPSPYLWSFSNLYQRGKYVSDGQWSSSAIDQQCGTMPMLKELANLDPTIPGSMVVAITPIEPPKPVPAPGSLELHDLGHRIRRTMLVLSYPWFDDQNVVSVEGMDPDGTPNNNRPNAFDDIKMVVDGSGKIIGGPWEATTQPGVYWTEHPMADGGAFIIAKGPQCCWELGDYHGPAWRQKENSVIYGTRDPNATYKRQGPPVKHGYIGVHHHRGYDLPRANISNAAAGCQVIRLNEKQLEFVNLTKQSARFMKDGLTATVLEAKDILP
jgi:lysozyme family protein